MRTCSHRDEDGRCPALLGLVADRDYPKRVLLDTGRDADKKYLTPVFDIRTNTLCYYHLKKKKGLFNTTPEQIRKDTKRSNSDGTHVRF